MLRAVWNLIGQELARGIDFRGRTPRPAFQIVTLAVVLSCWAFSAIGLPILALLLLPFFAMVHVRRLIDMGWSARSANICIGAITVSFVALLLLTLGREVDAIDLSETDMILIGFTAGLWLIFIAAEAFFSNFEFFVFLAVFGLILLPAPILTMVAFLVPASVPRGPSGLVAPTPARSPWGHKAPSAIVAAVLALASTPVLAQEPPAACLSPAQDIDTALASLFSDGWTVLPDGTLPQEVADQLVWLYVADYATGDTGGENLATLADLQAGTVKGLARKRDIPTSKTRLLTGTDGAMILIWRAPRAGAVEMQCKLALTEPDAPGDAPFTAGPITGNENMRVKRIALDRDAIADATGRDVAPALLIETWVSRAARGDQ